MDTSLPQATILNTEVRNFPSTIMGINYQISTWFPPEYSKPGHKFPVIYLMDGEMLLGQIAPMVLCFIWGQMVPNCLIVGLGHHVSTIEEWEKARLMDFTPSGNHDIELGHTRADEFLSFIKKELIPFIETTYPVDPTDRCLVGFSAGGEFTLYALLHEPDLFRRYLIGSGIWESILPQFLAYEEQLAKQRKSLPVHAFFSVGELEDDQVPYFHQFIDALGRRNYEGLRLETLVDKGENQVSTCPTAFSKGLRAIFKPE